MALAREPGAPVAVLAASGWDLLAREVARARRHSRAFAMVGVEGDQGTAERLASLTRVTDTIWSDQGQVFALLVEADRGSAERFLGRMRRCAPDLAQLKRPVIAVFPEDAATVGGLLAIIQAPQRPATSEVAESETAVKPI